MRRPVCGLVDKPPTTTGWGNLTHGNTQLLINLGHNNLQDWTVPLCMALGETEGSANMGMDSVSPTGDAVILSGGVKAWDNMRHTQVPVRPLDAVYQENGFGACDFMKVDVEGYEIPFLRGAVSTIRRYRPIILGEFNTDYMRDFGFSFGEVEQILAGLEYKWYVWTKAGWGDWTGTKKPTQDILLVPSNRAVDLACGRARQP